MSQLTKAIDAAAMDLVKAMEDPLAKASHDAMHHHAVHAAAAARSGKMDEAAQHSFMHARHAVENARGKGYYGMHDAVRRNMDHYKQEANDELQSPEYQQGYGDRSDNDKKHHKAVKHFKDGGGFVPHAGDKSFQEDYKGKKDGPKLGKK